MASIEDIIHNFMKALQSGDVAQSQSFFTDDGEWIAPEGAFKGKGELKRYLMWATDTLRGSKVEDTGIGIITQGNKAIYEHTISGIYKGKKWESLFFSEYEFKDEKIQRIRTVQDRLSSVKQLASGWFEKKIVNSIVAKAEEGLR